jgi:hypothetical protein
VHCIAIVGVITDDAMPTNVKLRVSHRKDRNSKNHRTGGGVLLAINNEYNSEYVPELDTDCELAWAKMNLKGNGNIYI